MGDMFSSPFPSDVRFVTLEIRAEHEVQTLLTAELALLHPHASPKRRREFSAGRLASRKALEDHGVQNPPPILLGKRGEPLWPSGFIGSISHSDTLAVAAVAKKETYQGLGLDLQSLRRTVNEDISARICHPEEQRWCAREQVDFQRRLLSIFSAKESLFKALYPLTHTVFYFLDAELVFENNVPVAARLLKNLGSGHESGNVYPLGILHTSSMILSHMIL